MGEKLPNWLKTHEIHAKSGVLILAYIQPGASRSAVKGIHQDRLKISIQAPPVDGAANDALLYFLRKKLEIPASRIHLLSGETSRLKNLWAEGVTPSWVIEKLSGS